MTVLSWSLRAPAGLVWVVIFGAASSAWAAPPPALDNALLRARALAATCTQCHGTEGRAATPPIPPLAGMPRDDLIAKLQAFRAGQAPSMVMQQIVRGYSEAQLAQLAQYFSEQR